MKSQTKWESYDDMLKRVGAEKAKKKEKRTKDCGGIKHIILPPILNEDKKEKK